MVNYEVKIGDDYYPFISLKYKRSYDIKPQKAVIILPIAQNFNSMLPVKIYRDSEQVWNGKITRIERTATTYEVTAYDIKRTLEFLTAPIRSYKHEYDGVIIQHQIQNLSEFSIGTIHNTLESANFEVEFGSENQTFDRLRVIRELAWMTGSELNVKPDGTVYYQKPTGTDKSSTIKFTYDDGLILEWIKPYTLSIGHKIKKAVVWGTGTGDATIFNVAQTDDYTDGDPIKEWQRKNLICKASCGSAAQAILDDWKNNFEYGKIKVLDLNEGFAYDVFDKIHIEDDRVGINGDYRIAEIEREYNNKTGEQTIITFTNVTRINTNLDDLIGTLKSTIKNVITAIDNYGRTRYYLDPSTLPIEVVKKHIFFDTFDRFDTNIWEEVINQGSVSTTIDDGLPAIKLTTNAANGDGVGIQTKNAAWQGNLKWKFLMKCRQSSMGTAIKTLFGMHLKVVAEIYGAYFVWIPSGETLKAYVYTGTTSYSTTISDPPDMTEYHLYGIETGDNKTYFYIDDELKAILNHVPPSTQNLKVRAEVTTYESAAKKLWIRAVAVQEV